MTGRIYNVLFLCTGNSARSIIAESILRKDGNLHSKSWLDFAEPDAPVMDFAFTVCNNAAGESCPIWPGQPMTAHWGIEDPAEVEGSDIEKEAAFVAAFRYLKNRIAAFTSLPLHSIDRLTLGTRLRDIGRIEGGSSGQARAG
jgi:protein-tyrosine-phosphatase